MKRQLFIVFCLTLGFVNGDDVGCTGTSSGGNPAIGCTTRGCCTWDNHITSSGLCDGQDEVCCYSELEPGCSLIGGGGGGEPGGSDSCLGTFDSNGNPAVGCVEIGCCEWNNQISALCGDANQACCYSRDLCGSGNCNNVRMVTREEWGARPPKWRTPMSMPVDYFFVHYTASPDCYNQVDCSAEMRSIQNFHMDVRDWSDIAYNYLIGGDGQVYEGRGWNYEGGHTLCYNDIAVAMCYIGYFNDKLPTAAALQAGRDMLNCAERDGALSSNYELFGHRDAGSTDCPGNMLYAEIQTWPEYSFRSISRC